MRPTILKTSSYFLVLNAASISDSKNTVIMLRDSKKLKILTQTLMNSKNSLNSRDIINNMNTLMNVKFKALMLMPISKNNLISLLIPLLNMAHQQLMQ